MQTETEKARKAFEAIMSTKGKIDLQRKGEGYANANIQTKWRYMLLGWTIRSTHAS
jgi:hypothetical protein